MPRTKQFDPNVALDQAVQVFWNQGYEATSMTDLLDAMGLHKGSFYDTFGSKHNLYLQAIQRYLQVRFDEFQQIAQGKDPKQAILAMFRAARQECLSGERNKGCMALNCALERAPSDPQAREAVQQAFTFHEKLFADLIKKGQAQNLIPKDKDPRATSKVLLGLTMAMRTYGKVNAPRATFDALYAQAKHVLGETH